MITREEILAADDRLVEKVDVPEWGGVLYVREMTGAESDAWGQEMMDRNEAGKSLVGLKAKLVAMTVTDEAGVRIFGDEDVEALNEKSSLVIDRLQEVACRLSGMTEDEVEELVGNSDGDRSDGSGSP